MSAVLFGFRAEGNDNDSISSEDPFRFIPGEGLEENGRVSVLDGRRRDSGRLS